jgi:hypothetical protein
MNKTFKNTIPEEPWRHEATNKHVLEQKAYVKQVFDEYVNDFLWNSPSTVRIIFVNLAVFVRILADLLFW